MVSLFVSGLELRAESHDDRVEHAEYGALDNGGETLGWQVIEAALWGVAIAIGAFWWRSTPATTRFIDLASYFLGFLTVIVGLFTFYNSHHEKLRIIDRMQIKSNIVDVQFDTTVEAWKLCLRVPHSPYRPTLIRLAECDKLNKYVGALKFNPDLFLPELTRLPELNLTDYSDPDVSTLAQRVQRRVIETNKLIDSYGTDLKSHWQMEALEEIFKELALPVFAFAFGLGLARRAIDLVRELPQRFRAPFQRIDRIVRRKLRRSRRCTGVLRNRWLGGRRQYLA
ncbi:hypothetical protein ABIB73_006194 [Bradyrhizobium sp. F1.4.3]|uniref:hypothetical protein n=1 Tax=Bradyrhizobium sp. F1.4.3 TaxID=3156356 RepID=UPI0033975E34